MSVGCKRRKFEQARTLGSILKKRKYVDNIYYQKLLSKKCRLLVKTKRKAMVELDNHLHKKQKVFDRGCLLHSEEYICNIYECSGVKCLDEYDKKIFMPYII